MLLFEIIILRFYFKVEPELRSKVLLHDGGNIWFSLSIYFYEFPKIDKNSEFFDSLAVSYTTMNAEVTVFIL